MIFIKGTPEMPRCGFSADIVDVFEGLGVPYTYRNVLEDMELRQGIKVFSQWPTIPQIYIDQEFIGGCDIVCELYDNGELEKMVQATPGKNAAGKPDQPTEHLGECQKRCL